MDLNNIILIFILIGFSLLFYKYFIPVLNKYNKNFLIDNDFKALILINPSHFSGVPISLSFSNIFTFLLFFANSLAANRPDTLPPAIIISESMFLFNIKLKLIH